MESLTITTIEELRAEILRLSIVEEEQLTVLKGRVNGPSAIFATVKDIFSRHGPPAKDNQGGYPDIVSMASRFVLPLVLNKTLFRHSNFLVKMLVGAVSQKASRFITASSTEGLLVKGKALLSGLFAKKRIAHEQV